MPWRKMIVAHRGARRQAPENTIPAFDRALDCSIDGIELDVQLTGDGIPVLYHDRTLARICGSRRRIGDYTCAELLALDWGSWFGKTFAGLPMLRFDEFLERYSARTRLFIEIKSTGSGEAIPTADRVLESIGRLVASERLPYIRILSFDHEVLGFVYQQRPDLSLVLNLEHPILPIGQFPYRDALVAVGCPLSRLSNGFVDAVHAQGKQVMTWALNTPAQAKKALGLDADILLTDDPAWLAGWLRLVIPGNKKLIR